MPLLLRVGDSVEFEALLSELLELSKTLDTTVRALVPEGVPRVLVSDTVIEEIEAGKVSRFRVFNKIDQVGDAKAEAA